MRSRHFFYLLVARNKDQIHAIMVQPNSQLAQRTRAVLVLFCSVLPAKYAGIKITNASNKTAIIYFITNIIF